MRRDSKAKLEFNPNGPGRWKKSIDLQPRNIWSEGAGFKTGRKYQAHLRRAVPEE